MSHENWYNILTDRLPDSVEVNGKNYPVHTSFRGLDFLFLIARRCRLDRHRKSDTCNELVSERNSGEQSSRLSGVAGICCLRTSAKVQTKNNGARSAPVFSYLHDSVYLYSDFLRYYQINLQTTPLHWFAFNALFEGLPEKSSTKQRIAYRCINIGRIKDKEERKRILQIQRAIAIPQKPMTAAEVGSLFG